MDFQTRSYHYCQSLAVLDRVNLSKYSDVVSSGVIDVPQLLPDKQDEQELEAIFVTSISRCTLLLCLV
jgi:hypothetical protein